MSTTKEVSSKLADLFVKNVYEKDLDSEEDIKQYLAKQMPLFEQQFMENLKPQDILYEQSKQEYLRQSQSMVRSNSQNKLRQSEGNPQVLRQNNFQTDRMLYGQQLDQQKQYYQQEQQLEKGIYPRMQIGQQILTQVIDNQGSNEDYGQILQKNILQLGGIEDTLGKMGISLQQNEMQQISLKSGQNNQSFPQKTPSMLPDPFARDPANRFVNEYNSQNGSNPIQFAQQKQQNFVAVGGNQMPFQSPFSQDPIQYQSFQNKPQQYQYSQYDQSSVRQNQQPQFQDSYFQNQNQFQNQLLNQQRLPEDTQRNERLAQQDYLQQLMLNQQNRLF